MSKKAAIIFPGQGAQAIGMGKDLSERYPACRELFERADEALGYDLSRICFEGPIEELTRSDRAQPAIFVASIAAVQALQIEKAGPDVVATAGLSSGEYAALHFAGVLTFEDALKVLDARSRFMQEACTQQAGAMLSVMGLSQEDLESVAAESGAEIANYNSPVQTVLSGTVEAIDRAEPLAKEKGAKRALKLNVAGAFHSSLMEPAAEQLALTLEHIPFSEPRLPVVSNVTAEPHGQPEAIKQRMIEQITGSVQWVRSVEWMRAQGVEQFIECGPGKVLTGLVKRIDKHVDLVNISDSVSVEEWVQQGT